MRRCCEPMKGDLWGPAIDGIAVIYDCRYMSLLGASQENKFRTMNSARIRLLRTFKIGQGIRPELYSQALFKHNA